MIKIVLRIRNNGRMIFFKNEYNNKNGINEINARIDTKTKS